MEQPTHIYPIIECRREKNTLVLQTTLRKKQDGKYYYWHFTRNAYVPEGKDDWTSAISGFSRDIYNAQMHGRMDTTLTYKNGDLIYPECATQMSEEDRMNPEKRMGGYIKEEIKKED